MQLTVRDVARLLRVPERDVYRFIEREELPAYRVNDQYRFNRADLLEWVSSHQIPVPAGLFPKHSESTSSLPLTQALERGGIVYGIAGRDKSAVLKAVTDRMPLPTGSDRQQLFEILVAREALASTGIGDGIAVPHVRNPIIFPVAQPFVTLALLAQPVDFGALDGRPVHCLFTLVSSTVRAHLQLLSRLAFSLRDSAMRDVIRTHGPAETVFSALRIAEATFKDPRPTGA